MSDAAAEWLAEFVESDPLPERMAADLLPALRAKLREDSPAGDALRTRLGLWISTEQDTRLNGGRRWKRLSSRMEPFQ
jgi:hypothetical protein